MAERVTVPDQRIAPKDQGLALVPLSAGAALFLGLTVLGVLEAAPAVPLADRLARTLFLTIPSSLGAIAGTAIVRRHFGLPGAAGLARAALAFLIALIAGSTFVGLAVLQPWGPLALAVLLTERKSALAIVVLPFVALRLTARWRARRSGADGAPAPPMRGLYLWMLAMLAANLLLFGWLFTLVSHRHR